MTDVLRGELEIDSDRGVIYFHLDEPADITRLNAITWLRICNLPTPIPTDRALDVTHMVGTDWRSNVAPATRNSNGPLG